MLCSATISLWNTFCTDTDTAVDLCTAEPEGEGHKAEVIEVKATRQEGEGHTFNVTSDNAQQEHVDQKAKLEDAFDIDVDELLEMLNVGGKVLWCLILAKVLHREKSVYGMVKITQNL